MTDNQLLAALIAAGAAFLLILRSLSRKNDRQTEEAIRGKPADPPKRYNMDLPNPPSATELWRYAAEVANPGPAGAAAPAAVETWRPARVPSVESDVIVPILQALITAACAALASGAAAWWIEIARPWQIAGGAFIIVLPAAWLWRMGIFSGLLEAGERITGRDLNRDTYVGEPHPMITNLPAPDPNTEKQRRLHQFLDDALAHGTTYAQMQTAGYSVRDWTLYRDTLTKLGATAPTPKGGWQLAVTAEEAHSLINGHVSWL